MKNWTLLNNKVKNNKIDKLINSVIIKLDLALIIVKNYEVDNLGSNAGKEIDKIIAKFKNIKKLSKVKKFIKNNIWNNPSL